MSRFYFHAPTTWAELHGSEHAWLRHVAHGPARTAWDLDGGLEPLDQAAQIVAMIPEAGTRGESYLHQYLRDALAERDRHSAAPTAAGRLADYDDGPLRRLMSSLRNVLTSTRLHVAGRELSGSDVALNTALAAGSEPVQLAAKLTGWGELHCWVNGPNRAWLADIIEGALDTGIYRRGIWFVGRPCVGQAVDQPDRQWADQGWGQVIELLRSGDDEPVVTSYSVSDTFPDVAAARVGGWAPQPLPDDWVPDWATTDGRNEWDTLSADTQDDYRREAIDDQWLALPPAERWSTAMAGLRAKPWLELTPESLGGTYFCGGMTVYDLLAPDREERVRAALNAERTK